MTKLTSQHHAHANHAAYSVEADDQMDGKFTEQGQDMRNKIAEATPLHCT